MTDRKKIWRVKGKNPINQTYFKNQELQFKQSKGKITSSNATLYNPATNTVIGPYTIAVFEILMSFRGKRALGKS